jgi:hypothetical protein
MSWFLDEIGRGSTGKEWDGMVHFKSMYKEGQECE